MATVRVLVVRAPGTNCDEETMHGWRLAGASPQLLHIERWIERPTLLREFDVLTLPGGFSYGDDIAAGKVFAAGLTGAILDEIRALVERGGGVLGICNGLQVLVKAGLLPGGTIAPDRVTVTYNASGRFEARWVRMKVCRTDCPFLLDTTFTEMPVEHGEGRVVARDETTLAALETGGHVALRYVDAEDRSADDKGRNADIERPAAERDLRTVAYPANPNGSDAAIAGLCDPTGRILGLMPHPDRHLDPTNHPLWTRRPPVDLPDGLRFFKSAVTFWKA
ncbi:MAG: phosphoribosylformylglycinamidine synthase subunit PurQ [Phycisphaerae bacterium]|nr:MAG: phosphoribosylformylglycinamidine synthase subunit PurQ [Planctomycetota bacterium]MBE7455713.1 phosphoribosylformylglycinamidine synthase subunit PurQ [Planctomycetia bacterium]MCK6463349.1 phosphoribosylformylglycinamidine synthase subunit PurQ [Phycisphaerae bacterium]MCL4716971.1 phosphoribosylformylglycinamidine synthase subunit PurQ [Phycisphaerae bacterium]MCQ3919465.1 phosphoribosylformylglycinamidine synthase [Planctomycetota bacterium]